MCPYEQALATVGRKNCNMALHLTTLHGTVKKSWRIVFFLKKALLGTLRRSRILTGTKEGEATVFLHECRHKV